MPRPLCPLAAPLAALICCAAVLQGAGKPWSWTSGSYALTWNLASDTARLVETGSSRRVWQGSLLPGFWLQFPDGTRRFVKASAAPESAGGRIALKLGSHGTGELEVVAEPWGVRFRSLTVRWTSTPPSIIGLYFGAAPLTPEQRDIVPSLERPFWPNWTAEGYCVPSAKGAPVQSFFRNWDLGHADLALGSFGPSLGTPYAAAFPRPLYAAAMGGTAGWLAVGPGAIPDAALILEIRASTAALHHLYREDLWGAPRGAQREWREPLRMAWAATAWDSFDKLFRSFEISKPATPEAQRSQWNSWGNFRNKQYDLRAIADAAAGFGVSTLVIDGGWESSTSSGTHDIARFPRFLDDLSYARAKGLAIGLWQSCGWVSDLEQAGLGAADLLLGEDGRPRRATWNMAADSGKSAKYCLDPSSPRTRDFLRRRTLRMMRDYTPDLIKLDFGYGLPGPDVSAPRDPALRGERLSVELMRIIRDAAREVNPRVAIQYYGIHPLMGAVTDVIALDDLGDAGGYETAAHQQWSVWASLAAGHGAVIMASSGYDWKADAEILLDTAVIGAPGSVLSVPMAGNAPLPAECIARRQALARWHRRTSTWRPLWLNSEKGTIGHEPQLLSFGRLERIGGEDRLTALALREQRPEEPVLAPIQGLRWQGRWALIAQDDESILHSRRLACIPFGAGTIELPLPAAPRQVLAVYAAREEPLHGWTFRRGRLRLSANLYPDILGILVVRH
jgi:hypothetical protein